MLKKKIKNKTNFQIGSLLQMYKTCNFYNRILCVNTLDLVINDL